MQIRAYEDIAELLAPALALRCPHCDVYAQMALQQVPDWQQLQATKPSRLGIVCVCPSCRRPVFLSSGRLLYETASISLDGRLEPVIKPKDAFETRRLPAALATLTEEALACYQYGHYQALALLANRIAQAADRQLGGNHKLTLFNTVNEIATMAEMDGALLRLCQRVLFDLQSASDVPSLSAAQASALIALTKDLLYQTFLRPGKLREALHGGLNSV